MAPGVGRPPSLGGRGSDWGICFIATVVPRVTVQVEKKPSLPKERKMVFRTRVMKVVERSCLRSTDERILARQISHQCMVGLL